MSFPAMFFKGLLKTLAGQFIDNGQDHAECIGEDFGTVINQYAKEFFSVSLIEEDLPGDLSAIGVLVDNRVAEFNRNGYTFFIYIDSTRKREEITNDLKTIFEKMVLSHETCHFVFYYELFLSIGPDSTATAYTQFQSKVSGQLESAITRETDSTSQTVTDEHMYDEFLRKFGKYDNTHFDRRKLTGHDYSVSNMYFFYYLMQK